MRWMALIITSSFCIALLAWAGEKPRAPHAVDGEQVYRTNCTRCHNTPPALTERETKVVVQHMRVRANLTAEQADAVLQYLIEDTRK